MRRQRQEVGVRLALGATRAAVARRVVGRSMLLVGGGVVVGVGAAVALTRLMSSMLHGVDSADPVTFAGAAAGLLTASAVACALPARRATRIDPMETLRAE